MGQSSSLPETPDENAGVVVMLTWMRLVKACLGLRLPLRVADSPTRHQVDSSQTEDAEFESARDRARILFAGQVREANEVDAHVFHQRELFADGRSSGLGEGCGSPAFRATEEQALR